MPAAPSRGAIVDMRELSLEWLVQAALVRGGLAVGRADDAVLEHFGKPRSTAYIADACRLELNRRARLEGE